MLVLLVVGMTLKSLLSMGALRLAGDSTLNFTAKMRLNLINAIMRARWSFFVSQAAGRLTNSATMEVSKAANVYLSVTSLAATIIQVAVFCVLATLTSWQLTLSAIGGGLLVILIMHRLVPISRRVGEQETNALNTFMIRLVEGLQMIKPLKAMHREDRLTPLLEHSNEEINRVQRRLQNIGLIMNYMREPLIAICMAVVVYVVAVKFKSSFSEFLFLLALFYKIMGQLGQIQNIYQKLASYEAIYWSVRKLTAAAESEREVVVPGKSAHLEKCLECRDLVFAYNEREAPVIQGLNVTIDVKSFVAIRGSSGAGKSTFIDLLLGLHTPQKGGVFLDGVSLGEVNLFDWRSRIGYVAQEVVLFRDTIANNVTLGDPAISREQVIRALTMAEAMDFVTQLPDQLDTVVAERGNSLSGGQRQRISIARALVREPELLILDEPTTALDPDAERAICETLQHLRTFTTIVAISHQPAIMEAADKAYLLENGSFSPIDLQRHEN